MRQAFPSEIGCVTRAHSANAFTAYGSRRIMAAMKESPLPGTHLVPSFGEDSTLAASALEQSAVRLKPSEVPAQERAKPASKEAYRKDLETFFTHPDDSKVLGRGSEHVVYEIASPEFAGNVYKINTEMSKGAIRELLRELDRPEEERDENFARKILDHWSESWTEEQGERKAFLENLRNRLGEEAVPKQQFLQQMMPRDFFDPSELFQDEPQMLERIKRLDEQERMPFRFPAWTSVQRRLETPDKKMNVSNHYAEWEVGKLDPHSSAGAERLATLEAGDRLLWQGNDEAMSLARRRELVLATCPDLQDFAATITQLEARAASGEEAASVELAQLKGEVAKTVRELEAFSKEQDTLLDLAGLGNAQFVKNDGRWGVRLPDVLPPNRWRRSNFERQITELQANGETATSLELLNGMAMVRALNALSVIADVPERVSVPGASTLDVKTLHRYAMDHFGFIFRSGATEEPEATERTVHAVAMESTIAQAPKAA